MLHLIPALIVIGTGYLIGKAVAEPQRIVVQEAPQTIPVQTVKIEVEVKK